MLRKWLRVLDFCNALSELLSLSDFCVAAPPDSGWHRAPKALARGSVQIKGTRCSRGCQSWARAAQPSCARTASCTQSSTPSHESSWDCCFHRHTHSLPSSSLFSACSWWQCWAGTGGQQENNPGRVQRRTNSHQWTAAPTRKHPHLCTPPGLFSSCWHTFHWSRHLNLNIVVFSPLFPPA